MFRLVSFKSLQAGFFGALLGAGACSITAATALYSGEVSAWNSSASQPAVKGYQIGRAVTAEEIEGWDIDVRPDGLGLPPGEGSVEDGEEIYEMKCAACHGAFGEGEKRWPKLAGGQGTLTDERPDKTVGSYWPYASTLWDYIHRAMPFNAPQSLTDKEVYALTAYVLNLNDIVDDEFVLNQDNLADIEMPNRDGFFVDTRPDVKNDRCMKGCRKADSIVVRHVISGITPTVHFQEGGSDGVAYQEESDKHVSLSDLSEREVVGSKIYEAACSACHSSGLAGAPTQGDANAWGPRIRQGNDRLYQHAINGYAGENGYMPAKGGQMHLTDEDVRMAVDFLIEAGRKSVAQK